MKYIFIKDIQIISKEMHMPQYGIVFHVLMWWVTKNMKFDLYSFIKVFGHRIWKFLIIHIKSHLMNWFLKLKFIIHNKILKMLKICVLFNMYEIQLFLMFK